ncbi:MAG TPA: FAD-dependent oxidoreductase, partial [Acidimicrobiales bacterium]|nr:FAD-dependent oxidoreductase [Acidimicrobiales bacterium]
MRAEVLVVGGGIVGLSCAWELARAGRDVTLVAPEPGRDGAAWVAAGMLAPVAEAHYGENSLSALLFESASRWKSFASDLEDASGVSVGYDQTGTLTVALTPSDRAALDDLLVYQRS